MVYYIAQQIRKKMKRMLGSRCEKKEDVVHWKKMILYEVLAETGFLLFIDSSSISQDDYDDGGGGDKLFFGMI